MATHIATGGIHHLTLTVTDVARTRDFYIGLLGFRVGREFGPRVMMTNGSVNIVLTPPPDPDRAIKDDRFNENRLGLDHVSFRVGSRDELEHALRLFDERGIPHGEIKDLGPEARLYVLAFRDPDNIQLELAAPYS